MKIAIVNDLPIAAEALRRALAFAPEHQVIWTAGDGLEALAYYAREKPDLVLMDLLMPRMDRVEATRRLMAEAPCAILVVTADVESNSARVFAAMGHGAIDAVDTPPLGPGDIQAAAQPLLTKIAAIAKLLGAASKARGRGPVDREPHSLSPALVAIGASAGGPAALATILEGLPRDFPGAIAIVQHVDARFAPGMAEWLGHQTSLPVRLAREGDPPTRGTVLLAGTNDHLVMRSGNLLGYTTEPNDHVYRPSVDVFLESVSNHWKGKVIGVLLTGMGSDGARGLKALRLKGHHTIAQDQATSAVYGMPKAAAQQSAAVEILALGHIAPRLIEKLAPTNRK